MVVLSQGVISQPSDILLLFKGHQFGYFIHPRTDHEGLGGWGALDGAGGQRHASAALLSLH